MAEYIEREAAIKATQFDDPDGYDLRVWHSSIAIDMKNRISKIPAADVVPVRHGRWGHRWICSNMSGYEYACSCSECGKPTYRVSTLEPMPEYCPNCGARMDGDGE